MPEPNLRSVTQAALERAAFAADVVLRAEDLAEAITQELRLHGLAVHFEARCIRPGPPPGRPMTTAELIAVGLAGPEAG